MWELALRIISYHIRSDHNSDQIRKSDTLNFAFANPLALNFAIVDLSLKCKEC